MACPQAAFDTAPYKAIEHPVHDGELLLYMPRRSLRCQYPNKLVDGTWHRQSAGKFSLQHAIAAVCALYGLSRCQPLGLCAAPGRSFTHLGILRGVVDNHSLRTQSESGAALIERRDSTLTVSMAADRLA